MTPEQTLDWLAQQHWEQCREERPIQDWIRRMKSMLPAQEPDDGYCKACDGWKCTAKAGCVALDNPPPQRKPLTDEQIREIWVEHGCEGEDAEGFARAIEAAHGIKGEAC